MHAFNPVKKHWLCITRWLLLLSLSNISLIVCGYCCGSTQPWYFLRQTTLIPFLIGLMWDRSNVCLWILENVISIEERNRAFLLSQGLPMIRGRFIAMLTGQRVNHLIKYCILLSDNLFVRKLLVQGVLDIIVKYSSIPYPLSLVHIFYLGISFPLINKQLRPLVYHFSLFTHLTKPGKTRWNPLIAKVIAAYQVWRFDWLVLIHNPRKVYGRFWIF